MKSMVVMFFFINIFTLSNLGFENEYRNNKIIYQKMIDDNVREDYSNSNISIELKVIDYLNIIVDKKIKNNLDDKLIKEFIQIKGSGAKDTLIRIKKGEYTKIIAICDSFK